MIEINFKGDNPTKIIKQLQQLSDDLQKKALRSGIVAAIKPLKSYMRANAPRRTGKLAASIGHVALSDTAKGRLGVSAPVAFLVGSTKDTGYKSYGKALWYDLGAKKGKKFSHATKATGFISNSLKANEAGFDTRFYKGLGRYLKRAGFA